MRARSLFRTRKNCGTLEVMYKPEGFLGYPRKEVPERPTDPGSFPETDSRHWYDLEFAGWRVGKHDIPPSPGDGPQGKRITLLLPGDHPYFSIYVEVFRREAEAVGMEVSVCSGDWDPHLQATQVGRTIRARPDFVVLVPCDIGESTNWYRKLNRAGIPVIASNLMPEMEGFKYLVAWTGPDDWGQTRQLAHAFAEQMNHTGAYVIIQHTPGTSVHIARTWGIITELARIAPDMVCLDKQFTGFDPDLTERVVAGWIEAYGDELKGIMSADDNLAQMGINRAVRRLAREDIIRVAVGGSPVGLNLLWRGNLHALSYQSPALDGSLPVQAAVDWFDGLSIDPLIYLPVRILTTETVEEFLSFRERVRSIEVETLRSSIITASHDEIKQFFQDLMYALTESETITPDYSRGVFIELLSEIHSVIKMYDLDERELIGTYADFFKKLFRRRSMAHTVNWLEQVALAVADRLLANRGGSRSLGERVEAYVQANYAKALSLKTMSFTFGVSAAYLGHIFKEQTGQSFSEYLNKYRLERAHYLLTHSTISAKEAARAVGYSDPNYFYRVFKKYRGVFPSELAGKGRSPSSSGPSVNDNP